VFLVGFAVKLFRLVRVRVLQNAIGISVKHGKQYNALAPMSTIDEIKSRIDIVDLVSEAGVKLRHAGKNYTGFCPFHENKRSPAFVVWPESGTWRCFGACNEGGDIFKFVMKREGLDFKEALQKLAIRAGVELTEFQRETPEVREAYDHLRKLLEDAVIFYRSHLFNNKDILTYLREKRGLTDATIETFGLGYAPQGWDAALTHFTQRGYSQQDLVDAGLLTVRESDSQNPNSESRVYDKFRNRIMIPIRDEQGRMAGFGARIVDPNDIPKFLNSPETPIFSKGRLLYGLDRARKPIRTADQAVIVEGYLDVIALHQAGYENVVSPMGTALTEDQLRLLKRSTRRIVLALDPDVAGQKAILRGLEAARSAMDKEGELGFDARGLLQNEARLQADLRVASIPDDLDPDEIVARDQEEWAKIIADAKPIVTHVMETLAAGQNVNDPKVKNQIAAQVLPLIEDLPSPLERDTYRQALARMLRVDERSLMGTQARGPVVKRKPRGMLSTPKAETAVATVNPVLRLESFFVGIVLRTPELVYQVDRKLEESNLSALSVDDFEYTDHQLIIQEIRQSLEQVDHDYHAYVMSRLPDSILPLAHELLVASEKFQQNADALRDDLLRAVKKMRLSRAAEQITQYRYLQEEAGEQGDARASEYEKEIARLIKLRMYMDRMKI
jgi:DNA primase